MDRDAKLAIYRTLVAGFDDLAVKGKASAYTAVNGNMFSFLTPDGLLAFRLSKDDIEAYEADFGPSSVIQYGSVMRGYVEIRDDVIEDEALVAELFQKCVAHGRSLKPKPTKTSR